MNIDLDTYPKVVRPAMLMLGVASYGFLVWFMFDEGHLSLGRNIDVFFLLIWLFGSLLLVLNVGPLKRFDQNTLVLCQALWCNVGAVTVALLVPHMLRLLLLALPLFGVVYAAFHLSKAQILLVAASTGLIYLTHVANLFTVQDVHIEFELMSGFAFAILLGGTVLIALELQRMRDQLVVRNQGLREAMTRLQELALKDDLTGLHNRRSIMDHLQRQKALADRGQPSFAVCYCDLDHFKRVNDEFGHAVGDVVLRQFAEIAKAEVRNIDSVARFGGEEFLLVLVDTDADTAAQVAQRLVDRTRAMEVPGTTKDFTLSVSVGVASYRAGEHVDDLIKRADHCLYMAKNTGRDRVVVAPR